MKAVETAVYIRPEYEHERHDDLWRHFEKIDKDHDRKISKIELFEFLDLRVRENGFEDGQFDRAVASELFEKMDRDNDELVTFDEFCKVYIEVEERLCHKLAQYRGRVMEIEAELESWNRKLDEVKLTEKLNPYGRFLLEEGVMTDSLLSLTISKFVYFEEGLFSKQKQEMYIKVAHGDYLKRTSEFKTDQPVDATFKM